MLIFIVIQVSSVFSFTVTVYYIAYYVFLLLFVTTRTVALFSYLCQFFVEFNLSPTVITV